MSNRIRGHLVILAVVMTPCLWLGHVIHSAVMAHKISANTKACIFYVDGQTAINAAVQRNIQLGVKVDEKLTEYVVDHQSQLLHDREVRVADTR